MKFCAACQQALKCSVVNLLPLAPLSYHLVTQNNSAGGMHASAALILQRATQTRDLTCTITREGLVPRRLPALCPH